MSVFAVVYSYTDEHERREEIRPSHRAFLERLGEVNLCAGPFGPDEDAGALLLLRATSKEKALALTEDDPFRTHGLVSNVHVRQWLPSLGELSATLAKS